MNKLLRLSIYTTLIPILSFFLHTTFPLSYVKTVTSRHSCSTLAHSSHKPSLFQLIPIHNGFPNRSFRFSGNHYFTLICIHFNKVSYHSFRLSSNSPHSTRFLWKSFFCSLQPVCTSFINPSMYPLKSQWDITHPCRTPLTFPCL